MPVPVQSMKKKSIANPSTHKYKPSEIKTVVTSTKLGLLNIIIQNSN